MANEFLIFAKNKDNLTGAIIKIIGGDRGLSTGSIHRQVVKNGVNVTYQAIHKTLNKMVEEGILTKKNKLYSINLKWALDLEKFAKNMKNLCLNRSPLQIDGLNDFKEVDSVKVFEFDSLGNAERFRKELQITYLENQNETRPYVSQTNHMKSPIGFSEKSLKIVEAIEKYRKPCYMLVSNNSPIDNWCANYYRRDIINIKMGVTPPTDSDIMVLGDEIVEMYLPGKVKELIDKIYHEGEIKDLNVREFYQEVYDKKNPTKVRIIKDTVIANQVRNNIMAYFKENLPAVSEKNASCLILLNKDGDKVLSVRRRNTRKWNGSIMLGSAEEAKDGETALETLLRGVTEELMVPIKSIEEISYIGKVNVAEVNENFGLNANFFAAKIDKEGMKKILDNVNSGKSYELSDAEVTSVKDLNKIQNLQPHYQVAIKKLEACFFTARKKT